MNINLWLESVTTVA